MNWDVIASSRLDDLTMPKSNGRPVNGHVVRGREVAKPDFDRMRDLVHKRGAEHEAAPAL